MLAPDLCDVTVHFNSYIKDKHTRATGRSSSAGENDKGAAAGPSSALDSSSESVDGDQKPPSGLEHSSTQAMLAQDPVPHHGTELFSGELKPSVASLQATVMSNATLAAAAAYQSQLGLTTTRPMTEQQAATSSLAHHHHHGDAALLHDYHSL
ncbi:hypothetical protein C0J52_20934 [Blattella germanica]|nr:hypothetical protein C0J52_20934 [Blattella germanica]